MATESNSEFYKTLGSLEKVTKTNLPKQFENVKDFTESAIHFANRCDITLALKDTIFAEMSAARLRQDAERRYADGLITADEYFQIHHESLELIFDGLIEEVKKAIIPACECSKTQQGNPYPKQLTVPEKHQLRIAKETLKMSDVMAKVMGGPTKEEAREIIRRLEGK